MSKKNYLKFFWKNFRKHDGVDIFVNLIRISRVVFATATLHVHKLPNNRLWIVPYYSLLVWTVLLAQMSPHPQVGYSITNKMGNTTFSAESWSIH